MDISGVFHNITGTKTPSLSKSDPLNRVESSSKFPNKEVVKGEIIDVTNKSIKIKVGDQIISGNLNLEGKLNIGDIRNFLIEMEAGKLRMTVVPETMENLKDMHLENVLKDLGQLSKENLALAKTLLDNNLPVNQDTLATLKRSMALFGKEDSNALQKSLLMMENELQVNSKNTENLNSLLDRNNNVTKNLQNIDTLLGQLEQSDPELATQIKNIFTEVADDLIQANTQNNNQNNPVINQQVAKDVQNLENPADLLKLISDNLGDDEVALKQNQTLGKELVNQPEVMDSKEAENSAKFKMLNDALNNIDNKSSKDDLANILLNKLSGKTDNKEVTEQLAKNILSNNLDDESGIAGNLKKILGDVTENLDDLDKNLSKSFDIGKDIKNPKELENHINDKLEKLEKAIELIKNSNSDSEVLRHLEKEVHTIKDKLTFANEIKNNVFVQIPFTLNNKSTNGELIVFKDKKNKKGSKDFASALISLDTANLGLFEAYVVKKNANVDIQFRFKEDFVKDLVKNNLTQLNNILSSKNIVLSNVSYKQIDEPFSIIDKEPKIDETYDNQQDGNPFKLDIRG